MFGLVCLTIIEKLKRNIQEKYKIEGKDSSGFLVNHSKSC